MIKPVGPICNLGCTYCYYLEKENIYSDKNGVKGFTMSDEILEQYIKEYIASQPLENPKAVFAWQGGEASLLGLDFYKKAVAFQQKHSDGRYMENTFQTNGMLLNDQWAEFFAKNNFLIGISIDGPEKLHDKFRVTKSGKGTWKKVMSSIELMKKHKVDFNVLTTVNSENANHPLEIYRFLIPPLTRGG